MRFWSWPKEHLAKRRPPRDVAVAVGHKGGTSGDAQAYLFMTNAKAVFLFHFAMHMHRGMPAREAFDRTVEAFTDEGRAELERDETGVKIGGVA